MRRSLAILACATAFGCNRHPKPAPKPAPVPVAETEKVEWRALSPDAKAEIRQFNLEDGTCRVEGVLGSSVVWTSKDCISTANQLHFASNDGERVVVIDPLPEFKNDNWGAALGLAGYQRGTLVHSNSLATLVKDPSKLRKSQRYVRWVQGTNDVTGLPPAITGDGLAVHFETVDNMKYDVRFDQAEGELLPVAPPETGQQMRTMYEYGNGQFAESMADVPKKFKRTAKKVEMRTVTPVAGPGAVRKTP
jgi:hypothetical protein